MSADASASGPVRRPRLAQRRKAVGLTQEALAELLEVERSTVVRWERGETGPLPWVRPKLASALRVSASQLEELLAGEGGDTAMPVPRQLPATVAHFTGRSAELRTLTRILDSAGVPGTVVISAIGGTAGVGKTALALHWAHQAAGRFPDGQLYVNLRGYDPDRPTPAADALAGFLRDLGVPGQDIPPDEDQRANRYRSLLAGRRVLVVLDNAGSVEQVQPLLPGSESCAVVVTSRDSLPGLLIRYGAARLDLDLLANADAIALLKELIGDRAGAEPQAVAALADRCGRLPLALRVAAELAAARPGVPLAHLAAELADERRRLDVLDSGGDPRTTVRAVFAWSYQRLDPGTARAFRLASLHPGADFEPYAIAALTASNLAGARRTLDALARAHLIQPAANGRYGMHDLLRGYARELAVSQDSDDERRAALTRLFDHYLHAAATAVDTLYPAERDIRPRVALPPTPIPPLTTAATAQAWLDAERGTLVAVIAHASRHGWPAHAVRLSATLFRYLYIGGHYQEAVVVYGDAQAAARQTGDRAAEAYALNHLAGVRWRQGRHQQAADFLEQATALFRQVGIRKSQATALANLGILYIDRGRYQEAAALIREALEIHRETGDRLSEGRALFGLGQIVERLGRYDEGVEYATQSLIIVRETGDRAMEGRALGLLAFLRRRQGLLRQAAGLSEEALAISRETGDRLEEAVDLLNLGNVAFQQGRVDEATDYLRQCLVVSKEGGNRDAEAEALTSLAEILLATGAPGDARANLTVALELGTELDLKHEQARAYYGLGRVCQTLGDEDEARRHWRQALAIFTELGVPEAGEVRARLAASEDATA